MPIGVLAMHYASKNHILQLHYNWIISKPQIVKKKSKYKTQAIPFIILVPDSGTGFFQLIPANTKRSATLIENLTNCKQSVYLERCGAVVKRRTRDR